MNSLPFASEFSPFTKDQGMGQFSCFYIFRVSSPIPIPSGSALLCYPQEEAGPALLKDACGGDRDSSPAPRISGSALTLSLGIDGRDGGGHLSATQAVTRQMSSGDRFSMLTILGLDHPHLCQQG